MDGIQLETAGRSQPHLPVLPPSSTVSLSVLPKTDSCYDTIESSTPLTSSSHNKQPESLMHDDVAEHERHSYSRKSSPKRSEIDSSEVKGRSRRGSSMVSYKEPSLNKKMRQAWFFFVLVQSF